MSINQSAILIIARRIAVVFLLGASALSAFAILGDKGKSPKSHSSLINENVSVVPGFFSLKSNFKFRGNYVLNPSKSDQYINLNTVITYHKGNTTYIIPLKKKIYITASNSGIQINR